MIAIRVGLAITFKKDAALFDLDVCVAMLQRKAGYTNLLVTFVTLKNEMYHFLKRSKLEQIFFCTSLRKLFFFFFGFVFKVLSK